MTNIEIHNQREVPKRRRNLAGESIVGQIESPDKFRQLRQPLRERPIEGIRGQIEMPEIPEFADLIRNRTGEGVVREVEEDEVGGVVEMNRNRFREIVESEAEALEGIEEAKLGRDVAGEAFVGKREVSDSVAGAEDSRPVAWGGVGVGPGREDVRWVGFNGGLEGEKGEAIGVERGGEGNEEGEEGEEGGKWGGGGGGHFGDFGLVVKLGVWNPPLLRRLELQRVSERRKKEGEILKF